MMIYPIHPDRVRKIKGSFAFIEHRFLHSGFWCELDQHSLLLYLFLVLVSDRYGLSYYTYDKICTLLKMTLDEYILARNNLIDKDLIAFDGRLFQVLALPESPKKSGRRPLIDRNDMQRYDPATVKKIIRDTFEKDEEQ